MIHFDNKGIILWCFQEMCWHLALRSCWCHRQKKNTLKALSVPRSMLAKLINWGQRLLS